MKDRHIMPAPRRKPSPEQQKAAAEKQAARRRKAREQKAAAAQAATPPNPEPQAVEPANLSPDLSAEALAKAEALAQGEAMAKAEDARKAEEQRHAEQKAADLAAEALAKAEATAKAEARQIRHRQAIASIDQHERQALAAFDFRRRTWAGRAIDIVKGRQHFDTQRTDIMARFDAERMTLRRDYQTLTERQVKTAQTV
jgi:hypothetical protein